MVCWILPMNIAIDIYIYFPEKLVQKFKCVLGVFIVISIYFDKIFRII